MANFPAALVFYNSKDKTKQKWRHKRVEITVSMRTLTRAPNERGTPLCADKGSETPPLLLLVSAGRYWEMVERLKINQFYGAPTAIRLLLKYGDQWVRKYDRSSLRTLGSGTTPKRCRGTALDSTRLERESSYLAWPKSFCCSGS